MGIGDRTAPERRAGRAVSQGATIRVMSGFYQGLEVPVDRDWLVVGRGRGADLVLAEPTISRAHAAIGCEGGVFFVEDLGSTNGTLLNGERRARSRLADGDEIQMGKLHLSVRMLEQEAA